tara:strand:- start:300 stop:911 length:612 start_codon:yes stop_codon:yes gene_type:complete
MTTRLNTQDISNMNRVERLKIINSISGIKSVNLIGTKSKNGITNLSIISSVTHIGSDPPLLSFISRPNKIVKRDTINNITEQPYFTINSVEKSKLHNAHLTSGKYPENTSEFQECDFKELYINKFPAPFVESSRIKIGLKVVEKINIKSNDTIMIIGLIQILQIPKNYLTEEKDKNIGVVGLNTYYSLNKENEFDYVRIQSEK